MGQGAGWNAREAAMRRKTLLRTRALVSCERSGVAAKGQSGTWQAEATFKCCMGHVNRRTFHVTKDAMAETALPANMIVTEPSVHAISLGTLTAVDATNGNSITNTGVEGVIVVADANARTVQFRTAAGVAIGAVQNLTASKTAVFGPFDPKVYGTDGVVRFLASNVAVTAIGCDLSRLLNAGTRTRKS